MWEYVQLIGLLLQSKVYFMSCHAMKVVVVRDLRGVRFRNVEIILSRLAKT